MLSTMIGKYSFISANLKGFLFQANELPAELTKNERILRLLRAKEKQRKS